LAGTSPRWGSTRRRWRRTAAPWRSARASSARATPWVAFDLTGVGQALLDLGRPAEAVPLLERAFALRQGQKLDPREHGETRLMLVRALWETGSDPRRARAILAEAQADFRKGGGRRMGRVEEIQAVAAALGDAAAKEPIGQMIEGGNKSDSFLKKEGWLSREEARRKIEEAKNKSRSAGCP
jgi:hypothetical protein